MSEYTDQSNNRMAREKRTTLVVEKTALNAAGIYRSAGWGGSEMWPRLPDRLNVLFIVRPSVFFGHPELSIRTRIYQIRTRIISVSIECPSATYIDTIVTIFQTTDKQRLYKNHINQTYLNITYFNAKIIKYFLTNKVHTIVRLTFQKRRSPDESCRWNFRIFAIFYEMPVLSQLLQLLLLSKKI